jgi:HPt (histidine-containing phosphotransfer) domain-containing protein
MTTQQSPEVAMIVFDREAALENVGGDAELLAELAVIFAEEYPPLIDAVCAGIATGDGEQVQRTAHSIKGAVSPFAAQAAYDAALRLENMGTDANLSGANDALADLEQQLALLGQALQGGGE